MKIHNINVEDLMGKERLSQLLDIFRIILWPGSAHDLHLVQLQSAILAGGRYPLRPEDGEGFVIDII